MNLDELTLFIYIMARVSGFVLFNPLLSRANVPGIVKAGIILSLSVFVFPGVHQEMSVPAGAIVLSIHILMELLLGFLVGLIVNFFFYIPQLAGFMIDSQMGMTMNQVYDAGAHANLSVTAIFLNIMMTLLFFVANGHHTLFRILITSGVSVPFGGVSLDIPVLVKGLLEMFVECTILAVKLCLPVLAAELLGQLGMGILMKVIPQINVFSINIELKVLIGLIMIFIMIAPFSEFLLDAEVMMLNSMEKFLQLAGA